MSYLCPYKGCGRKFVQSSGLSLHLNQGHPERDFSTVLGKRKLQIEREEERKRQVTSHCGSVETGPSAIPVTLQSLYLTSTSLYLTRLTPVTESNVTLSNLRISHCPRSGRDGILDATRISSPHLSCRLTILLCTKQNVSSLQNRNVREVLPLWNPNRPPLLLPSRLSQNPAIMVFFGYTLLLLCGTQWQCCQD